MQLYIYCLLISKGRIYIFAWCKMVRLMILCQSEPVFIREYAIAGIALCMERLWLRCYYVDLIFPARDPLIYRLLSFTRTHISVPPSRNPRLPPSTVFTESGVRAYCTLLTPPRARTHTVAAERPSSVSHVFRLSRSVAINSKKQQTTAHRLIWSSA